jgi:hypothetical protein
MTNDPFAEPIQSDFLDEDAKNAIEGALVAVEVLEYDPDRPTKVSKEGKKSPCVTVNLFVLDGDHAGLTYDETLLYGAVLPGLLKKHAGTGQPVLGRWEKGDPNPNFPKFRPWTIKSVKDDAAAMKVGMAWYEKREAEKQAAKQDPFAA